jgi:hypothetical protein
MERNQKPYSDFMRLSVEVATGIEPASVKQWATVRAKQSYQNKILSVLVSNTEVVHNYQFPFRFMSPIHCQLETQ